MATDELIDRITPFMLATKQSRSPKSVSSVIRGRASGTSAFLEFDLHNLVLNHLYGSLHFHEISDTLTNKRATDWGLYGDFIELHVGLVLAHQSILFPRLRFLLDNQHGRAEDDLLRRTSHCFHHTSICEFRLKFGET